MQPSPASRPISTVMAWRLAVVTLLLSLVFGLLVVSTAPAEGRNWTRQIAATREAQITYEKAMRQADRKIRQLRKARRQTLRALKQGRQNLERVKARRADVVARYEELRAELDTAKAVLAAVREPERTVGPLRVIVTPEGLALPASPALAIAEPPLSSPGHTGFAPGAEAVEEPVDVASLEGEVAALKQRVIVRRKAASAVRRKVHRVQRSLRARARQIRIIKRRRGAAIASRERAEAALAGRILSMSRLAQKRVAKKTKVRPGRNSGFTWPVRGRISQTYGCTGFYLNPPLGSCRHFHDGLDIVGYRGTPIRAAAVGVVSYIGWNPWDQHGRAFLVVVAHPGGYETLYGHVLPKRRVRVGQVVKKGEVIAFMGNTGRSTGVHLHLEMRRGRSIINPLLYL